MTTPNLPANIEAIAELDGQNVIAIERALITIPRQDGTTSVAQSPSDKIFAVLLHDGRTVYIDDHYGIDCDKFSDSANSVTSHYKTHADRMTAKRANAQLAEAQAELNRLKAEQEAARQKRAEAAKKGHAARVPKANKALPKAPVPSTNDELTNIVLLTRKLENRVNAAAAEMVGITNDVIVIIQELDKVSTPKLPAEIDVTKMSPDDKLALLRKLMG